MDLRGYGASDKPPRGYDTPTLAADVAGVVRALGAQRAVVVGHDWGGLDRVVDARPAAAGHAGVAAVAMAHPLTLRAALAGRRQRRAAGRLLAFQAPMAPERFLGDKDGVVTRAAGVVGARLAGRRDASERYARAMQVPFVAHTSMEYYRWAVRSVWRADGRRFAAARARRRQVPVLQIHGGLDPWVLPETAVRSQARVDGPAAVRDACRAAGHFPPEEAPDEVTACCSTGSLGCAAAGEGLGRRSLSRPRRRPGGDLVRALLRARLGRADVRGAFTAGAAHASSTSAADEPVLVVEGLLVEQVRAEQDERRHRARTGRRRVAGGVTAQRGERHDADDEERR